MFLFAFYCIQIKWPIIASLFNLAIDYLGFMGIDILFLSGFKNFNGRNSEVEEIRCCVSGEMCGIICVHGEYIVHNIVHGHCKTC